MSTAPNLSDAELRSKLQTRTHELSAELFVGSTRDLVESVSEAIAPVWPLKDYVAVNPYFGLRGRHFLDAYKHLKVVSDAEMLMPDAYYRVQYAKGNMDRAVLNAAIDELVADGIPGASTLDIKRLTEYLSVRKDENNESESPKSANPDRRYFTASERIDQQHDTRWTESITDEIGKICSGYYDEGQSRWLARTEDRQSLYSYWKRVASRDLRLEILGLKHLRNRIRSLPDCAIESIHLLLDELKIPASHRQHFLLCQVMQVPGWAAWTKYQDQKNAQETSNLTESKTETQPNDFAGLTAIRLAYDLVIQQSFSVDLKLPSEDGSSNHALPDDAEVDTPSTHNDMLRLAAQRALELVYRNELVNSLVSDTHVGSRIDEPSDSKTDVPEQSLAQMVFCIDVRSERIRRHIEAQSINIKTYGFAGFFALPIEFIEFGADQGTSQVPVLISPSIQVHECSKASPDSAQKLREKKVDSLRSNQDWRHFQSSGAGSFGFIETSGLLYAWEILKKTLGLGTERSSSCSHQSDLSSIVEQLTNEKGLDIQSLADVAEGALRGIGITDDFAKFVILCGHTSQTENNPLKASLECGACGGHSGQPNARVGAALLNNESIRSELASRGIQIPSSTQFVAAVHNTTTDAINFYDETDLPPELACELHDLKAVLKRASESTRGERLASLGCNSTKGVHRRANDWSEVRPEWGLAGNAAFIVGPRELSEKLNLNGRAFLHSYNATRDPGFQVLEQIMTAPMVVANWINMQYYASTVDHSRFGSGDKTIHNVVGNFGIFSGNGGDLKTGLPWQSLHDGKTLQHQPLRLAVVIQAPRAEISKIIDKHEMVRQLVSNGWMQLIAIEGNTGFRFSRNGTWESIVNPNNVSVEN